MERTIKNALWIPSTQPIWQIQTAPDPGARVLELTIESTGMSMMNVKVCLSGDQPNSALLSEFFIEWKGERKLYFHLPDWSETVERGNTEPGISESANDLSGSQLNSFRVSGRIPDRQELHSLSLTAGEYTLRDTCLEIKEICWLKSQPLIPLNDSEMLLESFTSPVYWSLEDWNRAESDPRHHLSGLDKQWIYARLFYQEAAGQPNRVCYERNYAVDIQDYQALITSVTIDERAELDVWLTLDGKETQLIQGRKGGGDSEEIRVSLNGNRLERVRMQMRKPVDRAVQDGQFITANFLWLVLERKGANPDKSHEPSPIERIAPPPDFESFETAALPLGLVMNHAELQALKLKLSTGRGKRYMEDLLREVEHNEAYVPESFVGAYLPVIWAVERTSTPWQDTQRWFSQLVYSGLAYTLTGEIRYGLTARRALLAIIRCKQWTISFVSRIPTGVHGYRAPFLEAHTAQAAALCYDFIYNLLSPEERRAVEDALYEKALPWLDMFLRKNKDGYLLHSNQGPVYSLGLFYACLVARKSHADVQPIFDRAVEWFHGMLVHYFAEDGSTGEGFAYWEYSTHYSVEAIHIVSRHLQISPAEFTHQAFPKTMDYVLNLRSLSRADLGFLRIGDCMDKFVRMGPSLLYFYRYYGDERALWLWNSFFRDAQKPFCPFFREPGIANPNSSSGQYTASGLLTLLWYEEREAAAPQLPTLQYFAKSERVLARTGAEYGDMLLFFEGGAQTFEHTHFDKGQFIFEAYGETLAMDPGMISYRDPSHPYYLDTTYHNVVTVGKLNQSYKDAEHAVVIRDMREQDDTVWICADLTNSYKELKRYRRRLLFVKPHYLVVLDDVEAEPGISGLQWNFHSGGGIKFVAQDRFLVEALKAEMTMAVVSDCKLDYQFNEYNAGGQIVSHNLILFPPPSASKLQIAAVLAPSRKGESSLLNITTAEMREKQAEFVIRGEWGEDHLFCNFDTDGGNATLERFAKNGSVMKSIIGASEKRGGKQWD